MSDKDLLPCPICTEEVYLVKSIGDVIMIQCVNCNLFMEGNSLESKDMIDSWNTRTTKTSDDELKRLLKIAADGAKAIVELHAKRGSCYRDYFQEDSDIARIKFIKSLQERIEE